MMQATQIKMTASKATRAARSLGRALKCNRAVARKLTATAIATSIAVTPVHASFMEDFYNSAGAAVNVTPANVLKTQSMGMISGGSMVWRVPQRNFSPFYFSPPTLKAGCGGIDAYLGAFGMANRAQFVTFLRNIGQNAAGLAFKVALQAMAPELNSQIQDIANTINEWNRHFGSSCQAAKALMDAGPNQFIKEKIQNARLWMTSTGASSDYSETEDAETNGSVAFSAVPDATNSGGKKVESIDQNILWQILDSGDMTMSDNEKMVMMSLLGTTVYVRVNTGTADEIPIALPYLPIINVHDLVGDATSSITLQLYSCGADPDCLNPTIPPSPTQHEVGFANMVYTKAVGLRNAIVTRVAPDINDLKLLTVTTSVPLYKIIQISALPSRAYLGDELLINYSMVVAQELATRYVEQVATDVEKLARTLGDESTSAWKKKAVDDLKERLKVIRTDMKAERSLLYENMSKQGAMIAQIEHMEQSLYGTMSAQLVANSRFGRQ